MATTVTKPETEVGAAPHCATVPSWPVDQNPFRPVSVHENNPHKPQELRPSGGDALQALLAFSAMHQQVRRRRSLASHLSGFDTIARTAELKAEFEPEEQFVLDEVLQLVAERAIAITGADGLGIALAEGNEIVLRASAGAVKPDVGARIQRDSAFSGACFRTAQIVRCDDTETDDRVNLNACRQLGARSMVAVPLCGRRRVIGLLEAFSAEPFGFNDSDVGSLELLAELILAALKPEDEDRFAQSAQAAEIKLAAPEIPSVAAPDEKLSAESAPDAASLAPPVKSETQAATEIWSVTQVEVGSVTHIMSLIKVSDVTEAAAAEPVPLLWPEVKQQPERVSADVASLEAITEPEPLARQRPGMIFALAAILVAALLAGGLWWGLKNGQFGDLFARAEHKVTTPEPATEQPISDSSSAAPSKANANPKAEPSANSDTSTDVNIAAPAENGSATPQELTKMPRITGIRHWSSADSTTIVLDLQDQVQYEAHRLSSPDRIYFDLHDTALAADLESKTIEVGDSLLARVRVAQPVSGLTRVVLETKGNSNYSVSLEPNPYRLVVQVRKLGADAKSQVNLFPDAAESERKKLAIMIPPPTREDLQLRARVPKMRIVVDAGHGGWDLGTVGKRGLLEKDLVLEIAQRLGKLLESRLDADVILTRNDDNYIPLDERASMANQAQADLFVSVHANYSDLPSARGVETYYTNLFSAPNAKDLETRDQDRTKNAISAVLTPAELHDKIEQSRRLAASVQRSLYGTLSGENSGLRDRGVKEASYVVLTETAMPGILAEVSFVSSPTDEQKLRSDGYREQIAEALYKGIARYAASSHGVKVASATK
jgi:N-acetylmuramoyl-L-alanine amidase/putative methionine-R-sulfoxide reductase with GAF domain